jgi:energy-coupling factor transporter ATP-binding protein EcfA2
MRPGPETLKQLNRLRSTWEQGEHVLISGATKSGKTALARHIVQLRVDNGGSVVVFVAKPNNDKTIIEDYLNNGFTRWKSFRKPNSTERRVLLWPDLTKLKTDKAKLAHQKDVFLDAFDKINDKGKWTVQIDEGLYTVSPTFLGMSDNLAMSHAVGRSNHLTMVTLTQRPAHLPLILYGSASHAFVGRTRELADQKRLAELGARESSKELATMIGTNGRHDFTWIPVAPDWPAEKMNLAD